jgi:hypothetical protein
MDGSIRRSLLTLEREKLLMKSRSYFHYMYYITGNARENVWRRKKFEPDDIFIYTWYNDVVSSSVRRPISSNECRIIKWLRSTNHFAENFGMLNAYKMSTHQRCFFVLHFLTFFVREKVKLIFSCTGRSLLVLHNNISSLKLKSLSESPTQFSTYCSICSA